MAFSFYQMPARLVYSHPGDRDLLQGQALAAAYAGGSPLLDTTGASGAPIVEVPAGPDAYGNAYEDPAGISPGEGGEWDRNGSWNSPGVAKAYGEDRPLGFNPNSRLSWLNETDNGYSGKPAYDAAEVGRLYQEGGLVDSPETALLKSKPTRLEAALANIQPMEADPEARRRSAFLDAPDSMAGIHAVRQQLAQQAGIPDQWRVHSTRELQAMIDKKANGDLEQPALLSGAAIPTSPNPATAADPKAWNSQGAGYGDYPMAQPGAAVASVEMPNYPMGRDSNDRMLEPPYGKNFKSRMPELTPRFAGRVPFNYWS